MKKTFRFIGLIIVAAIVGFAAMCVAIWANASDNAAIMLYLFVSAVTAFVGALVVNVDEESHDTIRHYDGRRNYGQAAIFVGTACLFMGTQQECDDLCDDLWHWGQQVEVRSLTGEETLFNVI